MQADPPNYFECRATNYSKCAQVLSIQQIRDSLDLPGFDPVAGMCVWSVRLDAPQPIADIIRRTTRAPSPSSPHSLIHRAAVLGSLSARGNFRPAFLRDHVGGATWSRNSGVASLHWVGIDFAHIEVEAGREDGDNFRTPLKHARSSCTRMRHLAGSGTRFSSRVIGIRRSPAVGPRFATAAAREGDDPGRHRVSSRSRSDGARLKGVG